MPAWRRLLMALRHLMAILLLPFVVVVVVPRALRAARIAFDTRWADGAAAWLGHATGALVFAAGLAMFAWCVALFGRVGRGTLAPWDPTRRLVAVGPYRHVRNPMISAVVAMVAGEALFLGSAALAAWGAAFVLINHAYFLLSEEPGLERRFDDGYRAYKQAVPRWIPRRRPWDG
ncbi:MAG TPA: isoprenylcysteine carboxylmethyltransferase family protein [Longimicrobium sp.]|nr:isoprenylcysteine carboxylmethyltransferase family protein [Longimicrobium sp.]